MIIEPLLQLTKKMLQKLDVSSDEMMKKNEQLIERSEGLLKKVIAWSDENKA